MSKRHWVAVLTALAKQQGLHFVLRCVAIGLSMERGHHGSGGRRAQAGSEFGDAESAWALLGTSSATAAWRGAPPAPLAGL